MKVRNVVDQTVAAITIAFALAFVTSSVSAQEGETFSFDRTFVPATGSKIADFVPKGWKIEEDVKGDVTADGISDHLLKLIENKPKKEDEMVDRNRVLLVVVADKTGKLRSAAVADKLLQCTSCGGAFYGVMDAPANVAIEKGVIVVSEDHGSRWVTEVTFKFRYEAKSDKFLLIGFDYNSRDRAVGGGASESTNYLTGTRITTKFGKRDKITRSKAGKKRISIDEIDSDEFESEATTRLGLG